MTSNEEQQFLNELEKKLWTSANKLLPSLDASQYKHVALGLVFLKYVSDSVGIRRRELAEQFTSGEHEYLPQPAPFRRGAAGGSREDANARHTPPRTGDGKKHAQRGRPGVLIPPPRAR